ncbi:MAG: SDR family oxidoreductase [Candidatus Omnitrophica bacterium]|nr:SDR family oxidoreductase [Candidatus Omnitrophota bacterium]MCM8777854.1 SDR family oxidoreductase [Candidatus Omnitrophota bacterium]
MDINGKVAIITGSGTGIGRAIAIEFAKNGASVVCCGRRLEKIQETVSIIKNLGGIAIAVKTDITKLEEVKNLGSETLKTFGSIDILFNNAGSFQTIGGLWEIEPEKWWKDVEVNLKGLMLCCWAVLPHMMKKNSGIIINMNGGGATFPLPGGSAYGCSKAAVMRLTETLAKELEMVGSGVIVFGIGPGLVRTEMTEFQVISEQGRKWIPSTKECFEKGKVNPPELCAKTAIELIKISCPEINGRNFGAGENIQELKRNLLKIKEDDLLVMRFKK